MKAIKLSCFFLTCAQVDYFAHVLNGLECLDQHNIHYMHGKQVMKKRTANYKEFAARSSGVLLCTDVAARGIDVPDIDWILQFDPPQDPDFFVHRIGRTARAGQEGNALVFLLPKEDAYIDFLKLKKVPITLEATKPLVVDCVPEVKKMAMDDRAVMEKGQKSFVSFVRAYKEHTCSFIFVLAQLPFAELAKGFGLLFFPRMADLKKYNIEFKGAPIKPSHIKFKDKTREKQRIEGMEKRKKKGQEERREREEMLAEKAKKRKAAGPKRRVKRVYKEIKAEWDDLADEARLMKKLKKGKITQAEYDRRLEELE